MNRQNESSAEATTENIENKLDPNTPERTVRSMQVILQGWI